MTIQRTFVAIKPDAVQRGLSGEILSRFEKVGLKIVAMKMKWMNPDFAKKHYAAHITKPFYPTLEKFMTEGPVIAFVLEGVNAIELVRKMCGATESASAAPGTIRGDYSHHTYKYADAKGTAIRNVVHASGNEEDAKMEIALWFSNDEIHSYKTVHELHTM